MEEYVHRVGRTGRAGKTGKAISFLERRDWGQAQPLIDILKEANQVGERMNELAVRSAFLVVLSYIYESDVQEQYILAL